MIERWEEKMVAAIDKCMARVRVRDAHEDDVKPTTIKEKEKKHMSMVYGDVYKSNSNLDICTNPIGVPVLG